MSLGLFSLSRGSVVPITPLWPCGVHARGTSDASSIRNVLAQRAKTRANLRPRRGPPTRCRTQRRSPLCGPRSGFVKCGSWFILFYPSSSQAPSPLEEAPVRKTPGLSCTRPLLDLGLGSDSCSSPASLPDCSTAPSPPDRPPGGALRSERPKPVPPVRPDSPSQQSFLLRKRTSWVPTRIRSYKNTPRDPPNIPLPLIISVSCGIRIKSPSNTSSRLSYSPNLRFIAVPPY
jgi:hypothetical protein